MKRRLAFWVLGSAGAYFVYAFSASRLAAQDPIAEVLLGRAGSVLPLAGVVLVLRLALVVFLPAFAAREIGRMALEWRRK